MLRDEIAEIVGYELHDPRLLTATVTDVRLSENRRDARVLVLIEGGTEAQIVSAMSALHKAAPYIRKQVAFALNFKVAPALHFVRDTVEERASRIEELLLEINHDEKETAQPEIDSE